MDGSRPRAYPACKPFETPCGNLVFMACIHDTKAAVKKCAGIGGNLGKQIGVVFLIQFLFWWKASHALSPFYPMALWCF